MLLYDNKLLQKDYIINITKTRAIFHLVAYGLLIIF